MGSSRFCNVTRFCINYTSTRSLYFYSMALLYTKTPNSCLTIISSSTIRLRPHGLFLPPGNHLSISFVIFLYFFSLQVCNFFGSLLSSNLCICSLQFILYCVNLSLILKMPNCSLTSLLFFCPKVYILPLVLKISFQQLHFLCYVIYLFIYCHISS